MLTGASYCSRHMHSIQTWLKPAARLDAAARSVSALDIPTAVLVQVCAHSAKAHQGTAVMVLPTGRAIVLQTQLQTCATGMGVSVLQEHNSSSNQQLLGQSSSPLHDHVSVYCSLHPHFAGISTPTRCSCSRNWYTHPCKQTPIC